MKKSEVSGQKSGISFEPAGNGIPEELNARPIQELDVRPLLAKGQEPFHAIMQAVDSLKRDEVLKLAAPFEPVPLYGVLGRKGFQHWTRENETAGERFWEIFFYREELPDDPDLDEAELLDDSGDDEGLIREIDVRGLEPPQPLEEVLGVLETMAYGEVLLVHHHRNPLILFDMLEERGYAHRTTEVEENYWQVRIWRRA